MTSDLRPTRPPAPPRAERIIAASRVVLGVSSVAAIWLDTSEPALFVSTAYILLGTYLAYALALLIQIWLPRSSPNRWPIATHVVDLATFSVLMILTEGPASPFFMYFVFSLFCATLRWGPRGTFWTAVAAITVYLALGVWASTVLQDPAFVLNWFLIRAVYLAVVAILVGYMGAHAERVQHELESLAKWPKTVVGERQALLRDALARTAAVLRVRGVLLAWEQQDEPSTNVASWQRGTFEWLVEPPGLLDDTPESAAAIAARVGTAHPTGWSVSGAGVSGRLYCLTSRRLTQDEMALGEIAAHLTSATLDSLHLLARLREAVASEERVRLARNLHDSVLQSLTGIALQLQTARSLLDREPQVARGRLREMQESIAGEQHRVRLLIGELRPFQTSEAFARGNLRARLSDLCDRIERQWGMRIHLGEVDSRSSQYNALHDDIFYLVNEALINAARHAHASSASVIVAGTESVVRVEVEDDGGGFPFAGTYDLNTLTTMNAGPHSLKDRVRTLAGQLVLETGTGGSRIAITLPVQTSRVSLSSVQPA